MNRLSRVLHFSLYPHRRLNFTREGWFFSVLAISMGLVAINTGHNLFYLILGLLLGLVVTSGVLSERVLRGIEVERHLPPEIRARSPFVVILEVRNPHRRKIAYALTVNDEAAFSPRRDVGFLSVLAPGESKRFHYLTQVPRRGRHRFHSIHLVTRFPFGLFEKTRIIPGEQSFVAYPAQTKVRDRSAGVRGRERVGRDKWRWGEEIAGFRPALPEDDHRRVHWPTSARMGQLMVKEFVEEREHPRTVFFDHRGKEGEAFERAVEQAAGLLEQLVQQGVAVGFTTWDGNFPSIANRGQLKPALFHLALIAPRVKGNRKILEQWCGRALREGGGIYLRGPHPPPTTLPRCEVVQL